MKTGDKLEDGNILLRIPPSKEIKLAVMPEDSGIMSWHDAMKLAPTIGDGKWRLPTKEELNWLYENKEAIGGFSSGRWYWSASEWNQYLACYQHFGGGVQSDDGKGWAGGAVRFVRSLDI